MIDTLSYAAGRKALVSSTLTYISLLAIWCFTPAVARAQSCANPVSCENALPGNPGWQITGSGDPTIQGFATDISVNVGQTVSFKVNTNASSYHLDIYRLGYYGGAGARKIATVNPSASLPQSQPACLTDAATKLYDCGNWAVSASWQVSSTAVSGIYFANVIRPDTGGTSQVFFIVRNDVSHSDLLFETADETWQAYNPYGGHSLYGDTGFNLANRAYKVSYNRPFNTASLETATWLFNAEYPMVRWLESNGYDVSYFTSVDGARNGSLITNHRLFLSVGHDEYWSAPRRANVEAALAAGVNMAFLSGNEVFWKTRWENSTDGTNTPYRTLVCYKETLANGILDPADPPTWTGTWRDPRFSPPADGRRPENALTGNLFMINGPGADNSNLSIQVPAADGKMRFWRNTSIATLSAGQTAVLPGGTLGYEWDADIDNGFRPAGLVPLSTATYTMAVDLLLDNGATYGAGPATHHLTLYRAPSGALVFGAGTVQWSWGLDATGGGSGPDTRMQQATINLFADMGVQPATIQPGVALATASPDIMPPTASVTSPVPGSTVQYGVPITLSGAAADLGGGVVGSVEVSTDGRQTWHRATGRENWTYTWTPTSLTGSATVAVRATDDSINMQPTPASASFTVAGGPNCPCSVWSTSAIPATPQTTIDTGSVEVGMKFRSDVTGYVTGVRFYKGTNNTGTHVGHLWTSAGAQLASVTFTNETVSGWQQASFSSPVAISANTTYIISYFAPVGQYAGDIGFFTYAAVDQPPLHALKDTTDGPNGLYVYGSGNTFPSNTYEETNYWVDVVFATSVPPTITAVASSPAPTSATITWTTNVSSTSRVDYGTSAASLNLNASNPAMVTSHSITLSTLTPSTTYYFRVTSTAGSLTTISPPTASAPATFATPATNAPPVISAVSAAAGSNSAQIVWATNVPTTSRVDYGTSASSLTLNASDPTLLTSHAMTLTGLVNGTIYYYRVTSVDTFGNAVTYPATANALLTFMICPCSVWNNSTLPGTPQVSDTSPVELGMKFRADVAGYVTGVRFYKGAANTGTHIGNLWTSTGTKLASVTFTNETTSGWQQASFSSPVAISANTTYIVSYYAPVGEYAATGAFFATAGVDQPPLHALASGVDGPNGVYLYATGGGFPANSFSSSNYWVDVQFSSSPGPTITAVTATPGTSSATITWTTNVASTSRVDYGTSASSLNLNVSNATLVTSHSMTLSTLTTGTTYYFRVTSVDSSNNSATSPATTLAPASFAITAPTGPVISTVAATTANSSAQIAWTTNEVSTTRVDYGTSASSLVLNVSDPTMVTSHGIALPGLLAGTTYYYRVTSVDSLGLSTTYPATTGAPLAFTTCPCSIWNNSTLPGTPETSDTSSVELGMAFRADVAGSVTGVRFYKGVDNTGTHIGDLWTTTGTKLASVIFTNETASGWQQANFSSPVSIAANTTYIISYYAPVGRYAADGGFFAAAGVDAPPLHALANTVAPNGVYVYAAGGGFPANTFNATNYWIDVLFSPTAGPTITAVTATPGTTNATITWTTSAASTSRVDYGTSASSLGLNVSDPALVTSHSLTLPGLTGGTTYYFRVTSVDASNNGSTSPITGAAPATFTTTAAATWSISGTISSGASATVTLSGAASATVTADASGNYTFAGLTSGTYTVTPSKTGGTFSPASQTVTISSANVTGVNFAATWSISGTLSSGASATVTLSGAASATITADASGNYTFTGLSNGTYTVTPTKTGVAFIPTSQTVTISSANVTAVNFAAGWSISGTLSSGASATVTLSGAASATVTADASGTYTFTGLANGTYTVTPTKTGVTFSPASQTVTISSANVTAVNFAATWSISGTLSSGASATVTLSGAASTTVTADASGNYTFTGLSNGTYTVTPTKTGVAFIPTSQTVTISGANLTGVNFTTVSGTTFSISGSITPSASGASATVTLSGAATATVTADASGNYSLVGLANGTYTVTPTKPGFRFTPANQTLTVTGANVTGVNFTGAAVPAPLTDAKVSKDNATAGSTIAAPAFSTTSGNELLLAFIAADNTGGTNTTVTGVSGGSLTWVLVVRTNVQGGTSEIWRAFAPSTVSNVTVTATLSKSVVSSISVLSFSGVDTSGTNGSGAIGATASASAGTGAPTANLVTTRNNSWVFGAGNDFDNAIARTLGAGQSLIHQYLTPTGDTYWVQMRNSATPLSGTTVTINDTAPATDRYNLSICEVRPPQ